MPDLQPRKRPRQKRSQATVDALVEACARILRRDGMTGLTTNAIAARAGVGIGSLYEFFPNREAILAELTRRRLDQLRATVEADLATALGLGDPLAATDLLLRRIVEAVSSEAELYRLLLHEAPFLSSLPETERLVDALFELARVGARAGGAALPEPEVDTWLVGRMLAHGVLEIALLDPDAGDRKRLTRALVRLTFRMLQGRDPGPPRRSALRVSPRAARGPGAR